MDLIDRLRKSTGKSPRYALDCDGITHLISAVFAEYTLCGNAFEGYSDAGVVGEGEKRWEPTHQGPVDCPQCAAQILACRGVRVAPHLNHRLTPPKYDAEFEEAMDVMDRER